LTGNFNELIRYFFHFSLHIVSAQRIKKVNSISKDTYAVELVAAVVQPLSFDFIIRVTVHFAKIICKRKIEY